jgi:positive regulator of sigma E activity
MTKSDRFLFTTLGILAAAVIAKLLGFFEAALFLGMVAGAGLAIVSMPNHNK